MFGGAVYRKVFYATSLGGLYLVGLIFGILRYLNNYIIYLINSCITKHKSRKSTLRRHHGVIIKAKAKRWTFQFTVVRRTYLELGSSSLVRRMKQCITSVWSLLIMTKAGTWADSLNRQFCADRVSLHLQQGWTFLKYYAQVHLLILFWYNIYSHNSFIHPFIHSFSHSVNNSLT